MKYCIILTEGIKLNNHIKILHYKSNKNHTLLFRTFILMRFQHADDNLSEV